jgi:tripartite-type tricarboxylate transporter receptor subunit TctC
MLRGFFMTPQATPDQVAFYVQLLNKVRELPEWREFMAKGAFRQTALTGQPYVDWLDRAESYHRVLMREAKLIAK